MTTHRFDRWLLVAVLALLASLVLTATDLASRTPTSYRPLAADAFTRFVIDPGATGEPIDPTRAPEPSASLTPAPSAAPSPPPRPVVHAVRKPSPRPLRASTGHRINGRASTYCCTHGLDGFYAAPGPALRIAMGGSAGADLRAWWRGRPVRVCSRYGCVTVRLVDWCFCHPGSPGEKLIDLEPAAMAVILPNYRVIGVASVTVSW